MQMVTSRQNILICIGLVIVMVDSESGTAMLKSYFNRKSGALNIMVCRLCKKDVKAAKVKSYLSNKM